jgi:nitrate reductase NapE component
VFPDNRPLHDSRRRDVATSLRSSRRLALSLRQFIAPAFAGTIFPIIVLAFIGESSLCLWLIVKGVDEQTWNARRAASRD